MGGRSELKVNLDLKKIPTPCFVVDDGVLKKNLRILDSVQERTGCKIILALKAFAMFCLFPIIRKTLCGAAVSSLNEARLGREEFDGEVHVCAPAYKDSEFNELMKLADHITFNSFSQWQRFRPRVVRHTGQVRCGIRINPEHSEVKVPLYDSCRRYSRLGVTFDQFRGQNLEGITGLHFHNLCELNADALERTLRVVEDKFGETIRTMEWINFGGGHHITRADYDIDKLCNLIIDFKKRYDVGVILEPGEAVVLNAGVLVVSVLDIVQNEMAIAILDTSAAAHMPDVLEMPYCPEIANAGQPGKHRYTYRLGGLTCLAGDVIGDYSFSEPLEVGSKLMFLDMAHYSMVKANTFNGVPLPAIAIHHAETGELCVVRKFGYEDYKNRLS